MDLGKAGFKIKTKDGVMKFKDRTL